MSSSSIRIIVQYHPDDEQSTNPSMVETILAFERDITIEEIVERACHRFYMTKSSGFDNDYNSSKFGLFLSFKGRQIRVFETSELKEGDECKLVALNDDGYNNTTNIKNQSRQVVAPKSGHDDDSVAKRYPPGTIVAIQCGDGRFYETVVKYHWKKPQKDHRWIYLQYKTSVDEKGKVRKGWHDLLRFRHFIVARPNKRVASIIAPSAEESIILVQPRQDGETRNKKMRMMYNVKKGDRVKIEWDRDLYFPGTVTKMCNVQGSIGQKVVFIEYDDGDECWCDLLKEKIEIIGSVHDENNLGGDEEDISDGDSFASIERDERMPTATQQQKHSSVSNDLMNVLPQHAVKFLEGENIKSSQSFLQARNCRLVKKFVVWREKMNMPLLAGKGANSIMSSWKTIVRRHAKAMARRGAAQKPLKKRGVNVHTKPKVPPSFVACSYQSAAPKRSFQRTLREDYSIGEEEGQGEKTPEPSQERERMLVTDETAAPDPVTSMDEESPPLPVGHASEF